MQGDSNKLTVLIKAGDESQYQQLIKTLDEMMLLGVKRYALVNITAAEAAYLHTKKGHGVGVHSAIEL